MTHDERTENEFELPDGFGVKVEKSLPKYPAFVPDEFDMEQLAQAYLEGSVGLVCFSIYTGTCEWERAYRLMNRFEAVAKHLGESKRREIIDYVDSHEGRCRGDNWHVFKSAFEPGFFTTPIDDAAIRRVANQVFNSIPDAPPEIIAERYGYGYDYLEILEDAQQEPFWKKWAEFCAREEDGLEQNNEPPKSD